MINYFFVISSAVAGLTLIIGAARSMRHVPAWIRIAIGIAGFCAVLWASLKFVQITHIILWNAAAGRVIQTCKISLIGIEAAIFILVFITGGFKKKSNNETVK